MEKNIAFQDLVNWCREYLQGIITQEELANNLNDLKLKRYIGIEEKIAIAQNIIYDTNYTIAPISLKIRDLEIAKVLKGYLAFFPNIDYTEEDLKLIEDCDIYTYENINQVLLVGSPDLFKMVEADYKKICEIVDSIVSQEDINYISNALAALDTDVLSKENKKLRRTFKEITNTSEGQKAIENLVKIAEFNDPAMRKVIESEAMKKLKEIK